ncbi:MAG: diguanylate cyclase [Actinomycetota bacterium]
MSLQKRLTFFFVVIVVVPLAVAGFLVHRVVTTEISRRATLTLDPALGATEAIYEQRVAALDSLVVAVQRPHFAELLDEGDRTSIDRFLGRVLTELEGLDFLAVTDTDGSLIGFFQQPPDFVSGFTPSSVDEILDEERVAEPEFARGRAGAIRFTGRGRVGSVIGGFWLDREFLAAASGEDVDLSVVAKDHVIASTVSLEGPATVIVPADNDTFEASIGEDVKADARPLGDSDAVLVASTPSAPISAKSREVLYYMLAVLLIAVASTSVLAYLLARLIVQPIGELAEGARAVAEGNFNNQIPVRSRDEIGHLTIAFNNMTNRLKDTISQLYSSRNKLERAVRRVGETLRSTHDMKQMLDLILNTAADALDADAGVLWFFTATRDSLYPTIARGVRVEPTIRIRVGDGIVGLVAERATTVLLPTQHGGPRPAHDEPAFPVMIAVPLYSEERITGVLAVYRRDADKVFTREELDTVTFLVEQGGLAIENVALHEEAQRLSLTDGLTGTWNRRYFQMQFRQVLATAHRFERPFSLLMLDLDRFKAINDTYGHQRGDATLVEFSQRVDGVLREVDTFARYGGEEFICLLSETDSYGAMTTAEKIRESIRTVPFGALGEEPINLTVSIGAASYPDHGDTFRSLVEAADQAMYRAKQEGRDRVRLAGEQPPPPLQIAK